MRVLFTTWEGGGHVPPALVVAQQLKARGAQVLFVSDEATRTAAVAAGLAFEPWTTAPNRQVRGDRADSLTDWRAKTPLGVVRSVCDAVMCRPADRYAHDALGLFEAFRPDVVVTNELLFGVMAAAEAKRLPLALLTGNVWCFPTRPDLPPFGPGFGPARTPFEVRREDAARVLIARLYDMGRRELNQARAKLGLSPVTRTLQQLDAVGLTVLGVARAFDYRATPPAGVVYAGPLAPPPVWADQALSPLIRGDGAPLVLASFSTTYQREERLLDRCVEALGRLPVRGVVTLGPALTRARPPQQDNVTILEAASHDTIVPHCAAVVCHGGHGTVVRPLMHGVPVLCLPTGRDQPENARRVAEHGAGLTLPRRSGARAIAAAIDSLITDPRYRAAAGELGQAIRAEADGGTRAASAIERYARAAAST